MQVQGYTDSFLNPKKDSDIENTTIDEVLKLLEIKQGDCYWALGLSTDSDYQIHLKRDTKSCFVNNYNPVLLKAWRANIDLQPVTNYCKAVAYMTAHFSSEHEKSETLRQAEKEIKIQEIKTKEAMYKIAEACNFTKINTPPWVFFTFFKLYKWYQVAQRITYMTVCLN